MRFVAVIELPGGSGNNPFPFNSRLMLELNMRHEQHLHCYFETGSRCSFDLIDQYGGRKPPLNHTIELSGKLVMSG
jgi:hypothetical protein